MTPIEKAYRRKYIKYVLHAFETMIGSRIAKVYPIINVTNRIMQCTRTTAFLISFIFLPRAALNNVGSAMTMENNPAVDTTMYSGAPSSLRNKGTTA